MTSEAQSLRVDTDSRAPTGSEDRSVGWRVRLRSPRVLDLASIAMATVVVRLPSLHQPLDRDLAQYGTIGWRLLHGDLPYRDLFELKQPLVYPVYAVIHLLSSHHTEAVRVAAIIAAGATAGLVYLLMAPVLGRVAALAGAGVFVVAGASSFVQGFDLNGEHLLSLLTTAAVLAAIRFRRSSWPWMPPLVGLLAGLVVLTKITGVFTAVVVALPIVAGGVGRRDRVRRLLGLGAGAAAPVIVVCALYAALDAFDELVDVTITFGILYNRRPNTDDNVPSLVARMLDVWDTWPGVLVVAGLAVGSMHLLLERRLRMVTATLLLWAASAWLGATYGIRDFPHYYAPVVPPAALLLTLPFREVVARRFVVARLAPFVHAVVVITVLVPFARDVASFHGLSPDEVAVQVYGEDALVWSDYEPVGRLIRKEARSGDRALVLGAEPGFHWFSGVPPASRYLLDYPLFTDSRRIPERNRDLCERPPEFVIVPWIEDWTGFAWSPGNVLDLDDYVLVIDINGTRVFRREGDGRLPSCRPLLAG
jgi:hypothetical protein